MQLTDLNKTPISKEIVNITVTNSKCKVVVDEVVKTDSKGKTKLDLDLKKEKRCKTASLLLIFSYNINLLEVTSTILFSLTIYVVFISGIVLIIILLKILISIFKKLKGE